MVLFFSLPAFNLSLAKPPTNPEQKEKPRKNLRGFGLPRPTPEGCRAIAPDEALPAPRTSRTRAPSPGKGEYLSVSATGKKNQRPGTKGKGTGAEGQRIVGDPRRASEASAVNRARKKGPGSAAQAR